MKFNFFLLIVAITIGFYFALAAFLGLKIDDPQILAEKYAPNFHFSSRERFFPCNYEKYFFDENGSEINAEQAKEKYLQKTQEEKLDDFEIFYNIDTSNQKETLIQYWSFFVFNEFINDHYGDAEVVTVSVDNSSGQIIRVVGSAHYGSYSKAFMANNQIRDLGHDHPMILVENGSHAMCPDKDGDGQIGAYELDNWYNAYGIYGWNENDANNGPYVLYTDRNYRLSPISQLSQKPLNLAKNLGLKINFLADLGLTKIEEKIYLPVGGWPADYSKIKDRLQNPENDFPLDWQYVVQNLGNFNFLTAGKMPNQENLENLDRLGGAQEMSGISTSSSLILTQEKTVLKNEIKAIDQKSKKSITNPETKILTTPPPRLLITAICPGIKESGQEAFSITNIDQTTVDLSKIDIFFVNSKGQEQKKNIKLTDMALITPGQQFLLSSSKTSEIPLWPSSDATFSSGLTQDGGIVIKDEKGNILDAVFWGEMTPGPFGLFAIHGGIKTGLCLKRQNFSDSEDNQKDFQLSTDLCFANGAGKNICNFLPIPKIEEIKIIEKKEITKATNKKSSSEKSGATKIALEAYPLVINEVMYNPTSSDTGREWIELFNSGDQKIDLTQLSLFEGNVNHKIYQRFQIYHIQPKGYAILANNPDKLIEDFPYLNNTAVFKCAISLNNENESLILKNQDLALNYYFYTSSSGAYGNGYSLQLIDNQWLVSLPTRNRQNALATTSLSSLENFLATSSISVSSTPEIIPSTTTPPQVRINEIMYNPQGSDEGREWVEIFNFGPNDADMSGWKFFEGGVNHNLYFGSSNSILSANNFAIISNNTSSFMAEFPNFSSLLIKSAFSLNNSGEPIALISNQKETLNDYFYSKDSGANGDGSSLQWFDGIWEGASATPGSQNIKLIIQNSTSAPTSTQENNASSTLPQETIIPPLPPEVPTSSTSSDTQI